MKSDPQLRQDIRTLQEEVLRLQSALIEAKSAPPVTVDRVVEKRVVQFNDKPETLAELARAKAQIEKLQSRPARVQTVDRVVKVEVPVDRVVYRDRPVEKVVTVEKRVPVVEYQDEPKTLRKLAKALAEIERLKALPPVAKETVRTVEVEKIVTKEIKVPVEVEKPVDRVVTVQVPVEVEKVVRVPVDNPALVAEIAGLKAEIAIMKRGGA